ncbi:MAG: flotillin family protein [Thermoplasmata archaeon]|nr:flotillin family protein [Thermoplasmata archaeon]
MIIYVTLIVVGTIIALLIYASRYKKVPPNKAMVVYGRRTADGLGYMVITGGGTFVVPIIEKYEFMDMGPYSIDLELNNLPTKIMGTKVRVKGSSTIVISHDKKKLYAAAEHFLKKTPQEITEIASKVIEGQIYYACKTMSYEEIDHDPAVVANQVFESSNQIFIDMGLEIRSLQIIDVKKKG